MSDKDCFPGPIMSEVSGTDFIKYHGLGNDFILIDARSSSMKSMMSAEEAAKVCSRNFGVGADGVIFAMEGSEGCDYSMRMYNSDGSTCEMCGNGIRCMAKFLMELEGKKLGEEFTRSIHTLAGPIVPTVKTNGLVKVDMGFPIFTGKDVPCTLTPTEGDKIVKSPMDISGKTYEVTAVSMGNPHSVVFVDSLDNMNPSFEEVGPLFESAPEFPAKVNAEFVEVYSPKHVRMKVWERGAGPTLACGTGACAVCIAGVLTGYTERNCKVSLPGGDLQILWREDGKVFMTGPAEEVFRGTLS
jgi:diaminopimelate epimerase